MKYDKTNSISIIWAVEDVQMSLNNMKESDWFIKRYGSCVKLTHEDCMDILSEVESDHDATLGVTWDTIENGIIEHLDEQEEGWNGVGTEDLPFKPKPIPGT